jgi:starch phosphorylase
MAKKNVSKKTARRSSATRTPSARGGAATTSRKPRRPPAGKPRKMKSVAGQPRPARDGSGRSPAQARVLGRLDALARNLWWTWTPRARRLFEGLDPGLWKSTHHSPIRVLAELSDTRIAALAGDERFLAELAGVERDLADYLKAPGWYRRTHTSARAKRLRVAYFCMEYGLHESLTLYSGGLGMLAGDHLKSASDLGVPMCAVGILWRRGYYQQEITHDGQVKVHYPPCDFALLPVRDSGKAFTMEIGPRRVRVKVWSLTVGRVELYLLDTDLPENHKDDRLLTSNLYGVGQPDYRLRQELLLGVGGVRALAALGVTPTVIHLNEGHAAFAGLERVRQLVAKGADYDDAVEAVRQSTVFTTHTPVPAGHDRFDPKLVTKFLRPTAAEIGLSPMQLLALGRVSDTNKHETFCMTVLALKLSARCNGVAELHGAVSREMWKQLYGVTVENPGPDLVPIGHVTNGIHPQSWIAEETHAFYEEHLRPRWNGAGPDDDWWARAADVPDSAFWALRLRLKKRLVSRVRELMRDQLVMHQASDADLNALYDTFHETALTIGFARRFATYKRATLIFHDADRLAKIVNNPDRPVQILFAGKAHPADVEGNEFVRMVHAMTRDQRFRGRIYLLQNYDKSIGELLTSGTDVWLNNPIRPMEASGTSGMKPPLNGGINCSILDGWWPEGYNGHNGWALGDGSELPDRAAQDARDANAIYQMLETEIVPAYYERNAEGIPLRWTAMMRESMRSCGAKFSTHRMLADYVRGYYLPSTH